MPRARLRGPALAIALALVASGTAALAGAVPASAASPTATANAATAITVDGTSPGRTFDGIGAISGGGGNTRLLADYPAAEQSQILDYLFKPGVGADLQILKVEIGGDTNSTDGAEPSIEHTQGNIDCNSGYQWWLMQQAKDRDPNIEFYGLAWGAPGWTDGFTSTNMITYLVDWLGCAKQHGFTIGYLGGDQNENSYSASWIESLRSAMNAAGYGSTQIVGGDNFGWSIADSMASDSALDAAVGVVGSHYPCGYLSSMTSCSSTANAESLGKPLWASENGSEDADTGAPAVARAINRGYIGGDMTAYINWPIVASAYQNTAFDSDGLITADQPWSGAYTVGRSLWAIAQTTQFTSPGWQYLNSATGYLQGSSTGADGSYVTYAAPDHSAWSTVIETMDASSPQTVTFNVSSDLPAGNLHVWSTDLSAPTGGNPHMVQDADLTASNGTYSLTVQPGYVYTVTTTTGQGASAAAGPARSILSLPYTDSFASYQTGQEATYFASMNGAFETAPCQGGRSGECLRQTAVGTPVCWDDCDSHNQPYTLMGDLSWSNYTVSSDVLFEQSNTTADLLGRVGQQAQNNNGLDAYHLQLSDSGTWTLLKTDDSWNSTTLASGTVAAPGTGTWHNLSLGFQGSTITAKIDGTAVATVTDTSYTGGQVGLGTTGYYPVEYSNFSVTPGTTTNLDGTYEIVGAGSGDALDATGQGTANGTAIEQWPWNGGTNQQWTLAQNSDGYYTITGVQSGRVLDIMNLTTWPGTQLELWDANGGTNQQWLIRPVGNGTYAIESRLDGNVLDVGSASTSAGAVIDQWPSNGGTNQQWKLVPVS